MLENSTTGLFELTLRNKTQCENGGEPHCHACICLVGFTGTKCEIELKSNVLTIAAHLLNDTFDLEEHRSIWSSESNFSSIVDYDTLVDRLVEAIWKELSGEQAYLHTTFNYTALTVNRTRNIGRRLHLLSLYTRQDYERFEFNFNLLVKALDKLAVYLQANETIRVEAVAFTQEWIRANNLTAVNQTTTQNATLFVNAETTNEERSMTLCRSVMSRLRESLNLTRAVADEFYHGYLNKSQEFNQTLEHYINVLTNLIDKTWTSIINYGFWRVTRRLSGLENFGEFGSNVTITKRSVKERDENPPAVFRASKTNLDLSVRAFVDSKSLKRKLSPTEFRKFLKESDI